MVVRGAEGGEKIIVLMHNFAGGGAERMFIRLANGFAQRGHPVVVVAVTADGVLKSEIDPAVEVVDLGCRRTLAAVRPLRAVIERMRPKAVLSGLVHINTLAVLAARTAVPRPRLILSERNTPSRDMLHSGSAATLAAHFIIPWSYRRADAIVAVSQGVAADLARMALLARHHIIVLPNPVVTDDLSERATVELDFPWPAGRGRRVLLSVGRLSPQKDFATLLQAVARLPDEHGCEVLILGEGPERPKLAALAQRLGIADRLHMPGFSRTAIAAMHRADLYVLSSHFEGSPNALVEAMAAGTPVVATDCRSGPREILEGGRLGPLVPVGDAGALARAIVQALTAPVGAPALQARAADFSCARSIDGYLRVLLAD